MTESLVMCSVCGNPVGHCDSNKHEAELKEKDRAYWLDRSKRIDVPTGSASPNLGPGVKPGTFSSYPVIFEKKYHGPQGAVPI